MSLGRGKSSRAAIWYARCFVTPSSAEMSTKRMAVRFGMTLGVDRSNASWHKNRRHRTHVFRVTSLNRKLGRNLIAAFRWHRRHRPASPCTATLSDRTGTAPGPTSTPRPLAPQPSRLPSASYPLIRSSKPSSLKKTTSSAGRSLIAGSRSRSAWSTAFPVRCRTLKSKRRLRFRSERT